MRGPLLVDASAIRRFIRAHDVAEPERFNRLVAYGHSALGDQPARSQGPMDLAKVQYFFTGRAENLPNAYLQFQFAADCPERVYPSSLTRQRNPSDRSVRTAPPRVAL